MGFRSVIIGEYGHHKWPGWFADKYQGFLSIPATKSWGSLASRVEAKSYGVTIENLPEDIQKSIDWSEVGRKTFVLVYLHECGGVTRCQIERGRITWSEPESWRHTAEIEHHYCYGCSDAPGKPITPPTERQS